MAEPDCQRPLRILRNARPRCWTRGSYPVNLFIPDPLVLIFQVFSPAIMIFAGVGVLLSVSIPLVPYLEVIPTFKSIIGSQGCRCEPRRPRRSLREHRKLFQAPRVLHRSATNGRNDRYNRENNGRSAEHLRDRNKGDGAGSSEWVALDDI